MNELAVRLNDLAPKFHQLFAGAEHVHGTCEITDDKRPDFKATIVAKTVRAPITDELWAEHLDGVRNIGVTPIRPDGLCSFGAIDIDSSRDLDLAALAGRIDRINLPLLTCRSKSGGAHLYLFAEAMPASDMQEQLRYCAKRLGSPHAEVFPKQTRLDVARGDAGSWILMPYFNANYTKRFAIDPTGKRLSARQFLEAANAMIEVKI